MGIMENKNLDTPSGKPKNFKKVKRKIIVDSQLQYSLIKWFMFVFIAASFIFYLLVNFIFVKMGMMLREHDGDVYLQLTNKLQHIQSISSGLFGVTFLLFLFFVFFGGLHLSRKIAGPIQSVKNTIDRILDGQEVNSIQFRKNDYFSDLQDKLNELITFIKKK
jgi:methyl-accepting chemotaxis protein